jgi:hypothetical protein
MQLPEWKPLPPHIKNDDSDSSGFLAALMLWVPVAVIGLGLLAILLGLVA